MVLAGKDGEVDLGNSKIGYIDNFSVNIDLGTEEISQLGDNWKAYLATAKGWNGSFSGSFDYGDTNGQKSIVDNLISSGASTSVTLKLKVSASLTLTGTAFITGIGITGSHGGKIAGSFNFQGSGAIAPAA